MKAQNAVTLDDFQLYIIERSEPITESGCWIWMKGTKPFGYGHIEIKRAGQKIQQAQRLSYLVFIGSIPNDHHVIHSCDIAQCVNPDHLRIGLSIDNMQDMYSKGRNGNKPKESCPKCGGEYTEDWGQRRCMTCRADYFSMRRKTQLLSK